MLRFFFFQIELINFMLTWLFLSHQLQTASCSKIIKYFVRFVYSLIVVSPSCLSRFIKTILFDKNHPVCTLKLQTSNPFNIPSLTHSVAPPVQDIKNFEVSNMLPYKFNSIYKQGRFTLTVVIGDFNPTENT